MYYNTWDYSSGCTTIDIDCDYSKTHTIDSCNPKCGCEYEKVTYDVQKSCDNETRCAWITCGVNNACTMIPESLYIDAEISCDDNNLVLLW